MRAISYNRWSKICLIDEGIIFLSVFYSKNIIIRDFWKEAIACSFCIRMPSINLICFVENERNIGHFWAGVEPLLIKMLKLLADNDNN